jgi:hypothetical protein
VTRIRKQLPVPGCEGDDWYDRIRCNWDECENPSSGLHRRHACHAARRHGSSQRCPMCEIKTFCCAQHADFWARSHITGQYGRLSAGVNGVYL